MWNILMHLEFLLKSGYRTRFILEYDKSATTQQNVSKYIIKHKLTENKNENKIKSYFHSSEMMWKKQKTNEENVCVILPLFSVHIAFPSLNVCGLDSVKHTRVRMRTRSSQNMQNNIVKLRTHWITNKTKSTWIIESSQATVQCRHTHTHTHIDVCQ